MKKIGILLHVYHLEALGWEQLVWGQPEKDRLGTLTKFVDFLLDLPINQSVTSIIYSGPSNKDGLSEGAYAKHYLEEHLESLRAFPRLKLKLDRLSPDDYKVFADRVAGLITGPLIKNTLDEVAHAAADFAGGRVDAVVQIAAASHAPRCLQAQAIVRQTGEIPNHQQWFVLASDTSFHSTQPADVVILEPPHRGDDPMVKFKPTLAEVMKTYFELSTAAK